MKLRVACLAQVRVFAACSARSSQALQQARMPDGSLLIASAPVLEEALAGPGSGPESGWGSGEAPEGAPAPEAGQDADPAAPREGAQTGQETTPGIGLGPGEAALTGAERGVRLPEGCSAVQRIPGGWSKYGWQADPQQWAKPPEDLQRTASQARLPLHGGYPALCLLLECCEIATALRTASCTCCMPVTRSLNLASAVCCGV